MAPKRSAKEEDLIDGDGLEDDEPVPAQSEESEESEEEEEEEETPPPKDKSSVQKPTPTTTTTQNPHSSSDFDSDSEDGSDSDSDKTQPSPSASDFTVMPISSKPMDDPSKLKKPTSKPTSPAFKPSPKRLAETEQNGKNSRRKNKLSNGDIEERKSGSIRLWSEDDEVAILQGMLNYRSKKGSEPSADMGAFHSFIKEALHVDISKDQLNNKIKRLKKKYQNNAEKGENGGDPVFSRPHEYKSFELSKKIWRGGTSTLKKSNTSHSNENGPKVDNSLAKPKEESKAIVLGEEVNDRDEVKVEKEDFSLMYPHLNATLESETYPYLSLSKGGRNLVKENLSLIGSVKVKEMEEKWKVLKVEELEVYSKKLELIKEQTKLLLDAIRSSDS